MDEAGPTLRADARRNQERIIDAARIGPLPPPPTYDEMNQVLLRFDT